MFCKVCGNWIKDSEPVCSACGAAKESRKNTDEFKWNLKDFPKPKERSDVEIDWQKGTLKDLGTGKMYSQSESIWYQAKEKSEQEPLAAATPEASQNTSGVYSFSKKKEDFQEVLDKAYDSISGETQGKKGVPVEGYDNLEIYEEADDFSDLMDINENEMARRATSVKEESAREENEEIDNYRLVTMYPTDDGRVAMNIMSKDEEEALKAAEKAELAELEIKRQVEKEVAEQAKKERQRKRLEEAEAIKSRVEEYKKAVEDSAREAMNKFNELISMEKQFKLDLEKLKNLEFEEAPARAEVEKIEETINEEDVVIDRLEDLMESFMPKTQKTEKQIVEPILLFENENSENEEEISQQDIRKTMDFILPQNESEYEAVFGEPKEEETNDVEKLIKDFSLKPKSKASDDDNKEMEIKIEESSGTKVTVKTQEISLVPESEIDKIKTKEVSLEQIRKGPKNVQVSVEVTSREGQSSVEVMRMHNGETHVKTIGDGSLESEGIYDEKGDYQTNFMEESPQIEQNQDVVEVEYPDEEPGREKDISRFSPTGPLGIVFDKVENEGLGLTPEEADRDIEKIFSGTEAHDETEPNDSIGNKGKDEVNSKFGVFSKILITLLVIILLTELTVIGIKVIAPDSAAAIKIESIEQSVLERVNKTIKGEEVYG